MNQTVYRSENCSICDLSIVGLLPWPINDAADDIAGLFEIEITKYFARHRLDGCCLRSEQVIRDDRPLPKDGDIPFDLIIRLLEEYIGKEDRKESDFATFIHLVVDELVEQLRALGKSVERDHILRDACKAVHLSGVSEAIFSSWVRHPETNPASADKPDRLEILKAAFIVAIIMRYTDFEEAMLASGEVLAGSWNPHLGSPLVQATQLGYCDTVKRLVKAGPSYGADIANEDMPHALRRAARGGHLEVIDFLLSESNRNDIVLDRLSGILRTAAQYQRWELVLALLGKYGDKLSERDLKTLLCLAAGHGADDMIIEIMKYDILPRNTRVSGCRKYPLREAVHHGHISTVKLLLDNGAIGDEVESHVDVLAQSVAMSGNFALFQLLREYYFWKPKVEWVFLPIAAEFGHLDFARYAIKHRKVQKRRHLGSDSTIDPFDYLCQLSVLRAVVAGRLSVVRWFAEEVGIDMNEVDFGEDVVGRKAVEQGSKNLTPLILAVDSGNADMARLLTQELGAEFLGEEYTSADCESGARDAREGQLEQWMWRSNLRKGFTKSYHCVRQRWVEAAFQIAKGQSS